MGLLESLALGGAALAVLGIFVALAVVFFIIYNRLVGLKVAVDTSLAQIDVQLKKRSDLVPNLVESVKGYVKHEAGLLKEVTQARTRFLNAKSVGEKAASSDLLTGALKSLFAVAENYPQLRASENFRELQSQLGEIENAIAFARSSYNDAAREYNTAIQSIPYNFLAPSLGYLQREFFQATAADRQAVKVKF